MTGIAGWSAIPGEDKAVNQVRPRQVAVLSDNKIREERDMNATNQKALIWIGAVLAVLYTAGYAVLMGLFPVPSPSLGAAQVAELYTQNNTQFRLGVMV